MEAYDVLAPGGPGYVSDNWSRFLAPPLWVLVASFFDNVEKWYLARVRVFRVRLSAYYQPVFDIVRGNHYHMLDRLSESGAFVSLEAVDLMFKLERTEMLSWFSLNFSARRDVYLASCRDRNASFDKKPS